VKVKEELDRFCEAMISIRKEIQEIIDGKYDKTDNVIKNAPHTAKLVVADNWTKPYAREKQHFPLQWVRANKFWPSVAKLITLMVIEI
jgi:glycine dehydrogenase